MSGRPGQAHFSVVPSPCNLLDRVHVHSVAQCMGDCCISAARDARRKPMHNPAEERGASIGLESGLAQFRDRAILECKSRLQAR